MADVQELIVDEAAEPISTHIHVFYEGDTTFLCGKPITVVLPDGIVEHADCPECVERDR